MTYMICLLYITEEPLPLTPSFVTPGWKDVNDETMMACHEGFKVSLTLFVADISTYPASGGVIS